MVYLFGHSKPSQIQDPSQVSCVESSQRWLLTVLQLLRSSTTIKKYFIYSVYWFEIQYLRQPSLRSADDDQSLDHKRTQTGRNSLCGRSPVPDGESTWLSPGRWHCQCRPLYLRLSYDDDWLVTKKREDWLPPLYRLAGWSPTPPRLPVGYSGWFFNSIVLWWDVRTTHCASYLKIFNDKKDQRPVRFSWTVRLTQVLRSTTLVFPSTLSCNT